MPSPPLAEYRTTCPICGQLSGVPWSVVTSGCETVTINLRCSCGHDWSATRVTDRFPPEDWCWPPPAGGLAVSVIVLGQKADRRLARR